jgi:hypothetical protein
MASPLVEEDAMIRNGYLKPNCCALGAALALAAATAIANPSAPRTSVPLVVADGTETAQARGSTAQHDYPPLQAGVRRAAAQGPEALRRYIFRTRYIYEYYYWNFVQFVPE